MMISGNFLKMTIHTNFVKNFIGFLQKKILCMSKKNPTFFLEYFRQEVAV